MRKTAIALIGAMAFAFGAANVPSDVLAKDKPKPAKVVVKKPAKPAKVKVASKCKPGEKWNATASINAGACEKRKAAKVKVKKPAKAAEKPAEKPATIKKPA
jgi:hypothetical protein